MEEKNNRVTMDHYGYPVVNHSTPPAWAPSAPVATAIPINDHSTPVSGPGPGPGAPQAMSVVNNVVVSPGVQYGHLPVTGYAVVETKPSSLPCCGIGIGWFMFIFGWFIAITWYAGAIVLLCTKVDPRERPGYIGCSIMVRISFALFFLNIFYIIYINYCYSHCCQRWIPANKKNKKNYIYYCLVYIRSITVNKSNNYLLATLTCEHIYIFHSFDPYS